MGLCVLTGKWPTYFVNHTNISIYPLLFSQKLIGVCKTPMSIDVCDLSIIFMRIQNLVTLFVMLYKSRNVKDIT